jgi:hypothetical protein
MVEFKFDDLVCNIVEYSRAEEGRKKQVQKKTQKRKIDNIVGM